MRKSYRSNSRWNAVYRANSNREELKDYLYRKGSVLGWKKRWFSLEGDTLTRFNSHTSEKSRGGLRLKSTFVVNYNNDRNRKVNGIPIYVFSIVNGTKRKYLGAVSMKKRDAWAGALTNAINALKAKEQVRSSVRRRRPSMKVQMDNLIAEASATDQSSKRADNQATSESEQFEKEKNSTGVLVQSSEGLQQKTHISSSVRARFKGALINLVRTLRYDSHFQEARIESSEFLSAISSELGRGNMIFMKEFLAADVIMKLANLLEEINDRARSPNESVSEIMALVVNEVLITRCFKYIMNREDGMMRFLTEADAQRSVNILLKTAFTTSENHELYCTIINLMTACCLYPSENGLDLVIEGFDELADWMIDNMLTEEDTEAITVVSIRFHALVSFLDTELPLGVRVSTMGLINAMSNTGIEREERMKVRSSCLCCGLDAQIENNRKACNAAEKTISNKDKEEQAKLLTLCYLYQESKLEDDEEEERDFNKDDLECLFYRLDRYLLSSVFAYGASCELFDSLLLQFEENDLENVEDAIIRCHEAIDNLRMMRGSCWKRKV